MKIAIITGASSGMGRQMALEIGDQFGGIDQIWLIARREDRLKELEGRMPAGIRCFPMNITSLQERQTFYRFLRRKSPG